MFNLNLKNPHCFFEDTTGRSVAYFCQLKNAKVNADLIKELKAISSEIGNRNARLCLHDGPDATFHDMIIIEKKENYYRPHMHLKKEESRHIIEGKMANFIFDKNGQVIDICMFERVSNFAFRISEGFYHASIPLTDTVIYHETKPGPFMGKTDSIFPYWAPDGSNSDEVDVYKKMLMTNLSHI